MSAPLAEQMLHVNLSRGQLKAVNAWPDGHMAGVAPARTASPASAETAAAAAAAAAAPPPPLPPPPPSATIDINEEHPRKVLFPIVVTESGITTDVNEEHL